MDTIGDAYIVAGLLPSEGDTTLTPGHFNAKSARVCQDMLDVAATMIKALAEHRATTGQDVDGRIGISVGMVVAGVLGRLQPRFHIHGPAMRAAEMLEQTGRVGAVHVSDVLMRTLQTAVLTSTANGDAAKDVRAKLLPEMLDPPRGWRIGNVVPRLGVMSPKRSVAAMPHRIASASSNGSASPANTLLLAAVPRRGSNGNFVTKAAVSEAADRLCNLNESCSNEAKRFSPEPCNLRMDWSPPGSKPHSPVRAPGNLRSPHLSAPPTPPTPSIDSGGAEETTAGHWKSPHPLATPKSPLRGALLLRLWKSGKSAFNGEGELGPAGEIKRPVSTAGMVAKGSPMSKPDNTTTQAQRNTPPGVSPAAAVKVSD
jgi:hypothetical protein